MSDLTATLIPDTPSRTAPKSFLQHARLIGFLTLISRFFGLARDVVSAHFLGAKLVAAAFTFAFTVPNLFRKLFGEGALSAAFIPLYSQSLKNESAQDANDFAAATVNLLCAILVGVTIVSEAIVWGILLFCHGLREDWVLSLRLAGIMLPYVVLICGAAFIGGILQVHHRFGLPAAAPIILNACHIAVLIIGARLIGLNARAAVDEHKQTQLAYWLAMVVLVAGVMQISILLPALRHTGFRFKLSAHIWTPAIKKMLLLSLPVAMGAGVLQFSVVLDKGIAMALMQVHSSGAGGVQIVSNTFSIFGHSARLPMEEGAPTRLDRAQTLYQFPLGVFAIALATAIFPSLSADAMNKDRKKFRDALRHANRSQLVGGVAGQRRVDPRGPAHRPAAVSARPEYTARCGFDRQINRGICHRHLGFLVIADHQPGVLCRSRHAHAAEDGSAQYRDQSGGGNPAALVAGRKRDGGRHGGQLCRAGAVDAMDAGPPNRRAGTAGKLLARSENADRHRGDGDRLLRSENLPAISA